jgi:hypothetical protein
LVPGLAAIQSGEAAAERRLRDPGEPMMHALKQPVFPSAASANAFETVLPVRLGFEGRHTVMSALMRFAGATLILSAPGLWLLPTHIADPSVALFKLGASIFFVFCGFALLLRNRAISLPEVYFDPRKREMRVMRKDRSGRPRTVIQRPYDSLGAAKIWRNKLEIWDVDGSVLISIPLDDPEARGALRMQLGKLVR